MYKYKVTGENDQGLIEVHMHKRLAEARKKALRLRNAQIRDIQANVVVEISSK